MSESTVPEGTSDASLDGAWLRFERHVTVQLRQGVNLIGRAEECHIVLADPLVSREHARIELDGLAATLTDLGSLNGVELNGRKLTEPVLLSSGDRLTLGAHVAVFGANRRQRATVGRPLAATQRVSMLPDDAQAARRAESPSFSAGPASLPPVQALSTLSPIAEKALTLGRGADAERLLKGVLQSLLQAARAGIFPGTTEFEQATVLATRIACLTREPRWVNYVFELALLGNRLLSAPTIERLHEAVRSASGFDRKLVAKYMQAMHERASEVTASDRFLMWRLEGLAAVASS
jgi:pSer/pThr/pTyr-binding forkhead associated (FHA) protein